MRQPPPRAEVCSSPAQSRVPRCCCYQWYNSLKCHSFASRCQAEFAELTVREVTFSFQGAGSKILLSFVLLLRGKNSSAKALPPAVKTGASSVPPVKSHRLGHSVAVTVKRCCPVASLCLQVWALPLSVADGRAEDK